MQNLSNDRLLSIEGEIRELKKKTALNMLAIGDRLIEAKELVPYGAWEAWLRDNAEISDRTARNFMRMAKTYKAEERQALADLEVTKLYYLAGLPEDKRQELITSADVKVMSTRELQKAVKESEAEGLLFKPIIANDEFYRLHDKFMNSGNLETMKAWYDTLVYFAQELAEIVLEIETRMGELLADQE